MVATAFAVAVHTNDDEVTGFAAVGETGSGDGYGMIAEDEIEILYETDFPQLRLPPGWTEGGDEAWLVWPAHVFEGYSAQRWWFFSLETEGWMATPTIDASANDYSMIVLQFDHRFYKPFPQSGQEGWIEGGIDGGLTYPYLIAHFNQTDVGPKSYDITRWAKDQSDIKIRFRVYMSSCSYEWEIDNVEVKATYQIVKPPYIPVIVPPQPKVGCKCICEDFVYFVKYLSIINDKYSSILLDEKSITLYLPRKWTYNILDAPGLLHYGEIGRYVMAVGLPSGCTPPGTYEYSIYINFESGGYSEDKVFQETMKVVNERDVEKGYKKFFEDAQEAIKGILDWDWTLDTDQVHDLNEDGELYLTSHKKKTKFDYGWVTPDKAMDIMLYEFKECYSELVENISILLVYDYGVEFGTFDYAPVIEIKDTHIVGDIVIKDMVLGYIKIENTTVDGNITIEGVLTEEITIKDSDVNGDIDITLEQDVIVLRIIGVRTPRSIVLRLIGFFIPQDLIIIVNRNRANESIMIEVRDNIILGNLAITANNNWVGRDLEVMVINNAVSRNIFTTLDSNRVKRDIYVLIERNLVCRNIETRVSNNPEVCRFLWIEVIANEAKNIYTRVLNNGLNRVSIRNNQAVARQLEVDILYNVVCNDIITWVNENWVGWYLYLIKLENIATRNIETAVIHNHASDTLLISKEGNLARTNDIITEIQRNDVSRIITISISNNTAAQDINMKIMDNHVVFTDINITIAGNLAFRDLWITIEENGAGRDIIIRIWNNLAFDSILIFIEENSSDGIFGISILGNIAGGVIWRSIVDNTWFVVWILVEGGNAPPPVGPVGPNPFLDAQAAGGDGDGDGLSDRYERIIGTDLAIDDTDEDGLLDGWDDANGNRVWDWNDMNNDSIMDPGEFERVGELGDPRNPAPGPGTRNWGSIASLFNNTAENPNPICRDIYVEVDFMAADPAIPGDVPHVLPAAARDMVVASFARHAIRLHIDDGLPVGPAGGMAPGAPNVGGELLPHIAPLAFWPRVAGPNNDFYDLKAAHFARNRLGIFHYAIVGHNITGGGLGVSWANEDDFLIAHADHARPNGPAATFMHELGHNLGLTRNPNLIWPAGVFRGIDSRIIPFNQYPSVMNYNAAEDFIGYSDGTIGPNDFNDWGNLNLRGILRWATHE